MQARTVQTPSEQLHLIQTRIEQPCTIQTLNKQLHLTETVIGQFRTIQTQIVQLLSNRKRPARMLSRRTRIPLAQIQM
jgi:hypothetical protein